MIITLIVMHLGLIALVLLTLPGTTPGRRRSSPGVHSPGRSTTTGSGELGLASRPWPARFFQVQRNQRTHHRALTLAVLSGQIERWH